MILGAGASRACTPRRGDRDYLPPLTTNLFDYRYEHTLAHYPLAKAAASDIRVVVNEGPLVIEQFLRDSTDPRARARYLQIPLYLQDLLTEVSHRYTPHAENLDRLINASLALESVLFVTLNYDLFLDHRLEVQTGSIESMDDYIQGDENWALVKLHGSVNWARTVEATVTVQDHRMIATFTEVGDELVDRIDPEIHLRNVRDMQAFRYDREISRLFFPALSVPLGSEDELVCRLEHVDFLRKRLQEADGLNLLVIGYSGADQEVLKLLRESGNSLRSLHVINHEPGAGAGAQGRIMDQFGGREVEANPGVSNVEFSTWAQSGQLENYFESLE